MTEIDKIKIKKLKDKLKKLEQAKKKLTKHKKIPQRRIPQNQIRVTPPPNNKPISFPQTMSSGIPNDKNDAASIKKLNIGIKENETEMVNLKKSAIKELANLKQDVEEVKRKVGRPKGSTKPKENIKKQLEEEPKPIKKQDVEEVKRKVGKPKDSTKPIEEKKIEVEKNPTKQIEVEKPTKPKFESHIDIDKYLKPTKIEPYKWTIIRSLF